jgi:holo-[acyl-carrier protein] synthase
VIGIGIDAVELDRFGGALERRPRIAERLFTVGERTAMAARANPTPGLGARFAAKEAVLKALGVGIGACSWHDIEVVGAGEAPRLELHGRAASLAAELGVGSWRLSLTHTERTAQAVAVALADA